MKCQIIKETFCAYSIMAESMQRWTGGSDVRITIGFLRYWEVFISLLQNAGGQYHTIKRTNLMPAECVIAKYI
jgi:hypothetical protein